MAKKNNEGFEENKSKINNPGRRDALKAMAGIPVLGVLGYSSIKKWKLDKDKNQQIIKELGLGEFELPKSFAPSKGPKGDLLRIGIIGFGSRAQTHANALGYIHPSDQKRRTENGTIKNWLAQENLNVAWTGICDVFDLHAERGIETASNELRAGEGPHPKLPIKRYRTYQEMLDDKDIDAVMIATPDHHHATIATAAAKAGKHIYVEKSVALLEDELYTLYDTVKNSNIVFQLGHQVPQNVVFKQAKEIIKKDILGKITLIETTTNRNTASGAWIRHLDANGNPKPGDEKTIDWKQWLGNTPEVPFSIDRFYNWTKWFAYDSGLIGQLFTHEYDAVNQLLRIGIPKTVVSSGGIYYWKDNREMPDVLHCAFEYPNHDMTLLYTATLANSRPRGRVFMGRDASMELGSAINITADRNSEKYKEQIAKGLIDPSVPMLTLDPNSGVDGTTTATEKYYASRGLISTSIGGVEVDITYLHIKEWIDCIRSGKPTSANIEMAFEEGVTCIMAHKSYVEKRMVEWDPIARRIV